MKIKLSDTTQFTRRPCPIPYKLYKANYEVVDELLKPGIIRRNSSEFCLTAFPIAKKNGKILLEAGFRNLNKSALKIACAFSNMAIPKSTYFTNSNLKMAITKFQ